MMQQSITANAKPKSKSIMRETAWHTILTFASTLAIQITTFAILAIAALIMQAEDFARLSLIVAATMLANAFFELGMNITSTKMYGDSKDEAYLRAAFAVRILCVPLSVVIAVIMFAVSGTLDIAAGVALGAVLNLWNGVRATDQARQDYGSFMRASAAFALVRAVAGGGTLYLSRDPLLTAIATFALPVPAAALSKSARFVRGAFAGSRRMATEMIWYASHVYINAAAFIAIPYMSQFIMAEKLDATAIGTFGLVLTFCGPISLLIYSLRSVVLPKILGEGAQVENMLWSRKGLAIITAGWVALMVGGLILAFGLQLFYGHKFPEISTAFLWYFAGFAATSMVGLYSLSVHTQGVPHLSNAINVIRILALAVFLSQFGHSLNSMIIMTALIMCTGEVVLTLLLGLRRWRKMQ